MTAFRFSRLRLAWWFAIGLVIVLMLSLAWAGFWSLQSFQALKAQDLSQSRQAAAHALPIVQVFSQLTFEGVPDLVIWHKGLWLVANSEKISQDVATSLELGPDENLPSLGDVIEEPLQALETVNRQLPKTFLLHYFISNQQQAQLLTLTTNLRLIKDRVMTGQQTWLILFQNSQELRATGGFMGSVAFITLQDGSITKIDVQDIYQPAGQLKGFIEPPAGVKEYLSGGKGWQLTDANWSPDFPTSAQTITQMLEASGYPEINGVVAINLDLVQSLLQITGPINLPDYQTQVTSRNLPEVLRSTRTDFFAGSLAKQQLLANFTTHLKQVLMSLPRAKQLELLPFLRAETESKNLQIFADSPELQDFLSQHQVTGDQFPLRLKPDFFLEFVESNVGINKVNQKVTREWLVNLTPTQSVVTILFTNSNQATDRPQLSPQTQGARHLHYVNYQRLYVFPSTQVESITYQGQAITKWDEKLVTTHSGQQLKEIGFLIVVRETESAQLEIALTHPILKSDDTLLIPHQSGVPSSLVQITWGPTKPWVLPLTRDLEFTLP